MQIFRTPLKTNNINRRLQCIFEVKDNMPVTTMHLLLFFSPFVNPFLTKKFQICFRMSPIILLNYEYFVLEALYFPLLSSKLTFCDYEYFSTTFNFNTGFTC